jgi:biopolymer transport protein ExbB
VKSIDVVQRVLLQSGTAWILWLLGALSAVSVGIIIERWLFLRARECEPRMLARSIRAHLVRRNFAAAAEELAKTKSVAGAVAAAGLQLAALGPAAVEKSMQSAVAIERGLLERWLAYLGTVGNNAPFIGLFGTVIGVIGAFKELGHDAVGRVVEAGQTSQLASQAVMTSIAEALVATAVGIFVALPAVAAFNYFQRRIASLLLATDALANLVIAYVADQRTEQRDDLEQERGR